MATLRSSLRFALRHHRIGRGVGAANVRGTASFHSHCYEQAHGFTFSPAGDGQGGSSHRRRFDPPRTHGTFRYYALQMWLQYKRRFETPAWQRHVKDYRGCGGAERVKRDLAAKQEAARKAGAARAGAPRKGPLLPVGRQLVAYLSPATQHHREWHPRLGLHFLTAPNGRAFHELTSLHWPAWCDAIFVSVLNRVEGLLKTSDILSQLNVLTRVTFSLIPLTMMVRFKAARAMRRHGAQVALRWFYPTRGFVWSLVAAPIVLVGVAYLISLEQTPITGRTRSLFVSEGERQEIVRAFVGQEAAATEDDWLTLLRRMLGDEAIGAPAGTLLGGQRLVSRADWRVAYVEDTLRALEAGIPLLGASSLRDDHSVAGLVVPYAAPPLPNAVLAPRYPVLVIDRPEPNAFSCGFAPIGNSGAIGPGVIVVFTGCLAATMRNEAGYGAPQPSREEGEHLAVLLSHELAHLLCSHTLEQHASDIQRPQLRKIFADVVRTFIYPLTWVLGPFVNEAISASLTTGFDDVHGVSSSCESRLHEAEADAVSLRILANADIDPRVAISYWQDRLETPPTTENAHEAPSGLQWHSTVDRARAGFLRTHPVDRERLAAIKADLGRWPRAA